jgi:hypothetical protein
MNAMDLLPDVLLAAAITVIGIRVMLDSNLRGATGWFILFCVVLSLCWMRLQLFWLGVAEAFIGAFLTGWIVRSAPSSVMEVPDADDLSRETDGVSPGSLFRYPHLVIPLTGALVFMGLAAASGLYFHRLISFSMCTVYAVAGTVVGGGGFFAMTGRTHLLHRVLAINLFGKGVFLLIVGFACQASFAMDAPAFMVASGLLVVCLASLLVVLRMGRYHGGAEPQVSDSGTAP